MIRKLFKDSLSSALVPVIKLVITFIMSPLIVHALGNYDYGVWEIVFSIIAYLEFMDFGLLPAIVRNVARYKALDDLEELRKIYSTSLAFFLPVGFVLGVGFLVFSYWAPGVFPQEPIGTAGKYSLFFMIIAVQVFFAFVGSVFDCHIEGLQLYSIRNTATIIFSVAGALIIYPLLKNGGGLLTLAVVNTCGLSLKYLLYAAILATRKFGGFRFNLASVSRKTLQGLLNYGVKSFVWALSLRIATLTDPLIIGAYLGAAVVPFYMIPYNFISQAKGLIWSVTRVFLPAFSGLDARSEIEKTKALYFGASRLMLGIILPLVGGICLLGPSFLAHWMGPEYADKGRYVLYIIAAAHLIQWINPFSRRYLMAIDRHEILAKVGIAGALVNLALSFILVRYIGKEGVAMGTLLPLLVVEPYLLYKTCIALDSTVRHYIAKVVLPLCIPIAVFLVFLTGSKTVVPVCSMIDVLLQATASMLVYLPLFIMLALSRDERGMLLDKIRSRFTRKSKELHL